MRPHKINLPELFGNQPYFDTDSTP